MINIYVDASLSKKCSCVGVVYRLATHADNTIIHTATFPGGMTPNEGEMAAIVEAGLRFPLFADQIRNVVNKELEQVVLFTDSATCVRLLTSTHSIDVNSRIGKLAKAAKCVWNELRTNKFCYGWCVQQIRRVDNLANEPAQTSNAFWRKIL